MPSSTELAVPAERVMMRSSSSAANPATSIMRSVHCHPVGIELYDVDSALLKRGGSRSLFYSTALTNIGARPCHAFWLGLSEKNSCDDVEGRYLVAPTSFKESGDFDLEGMTRVFDCMFD